MGVTIESLALDVMHVLDLSITQLVVGRVFRLLIAGNFARCRSKLKMVRDNENMKLLRRKMKVFYQNRPRDRGTKTVIGKLTLSMLGTKKSPKLKAKAAETRNILEILPELLEDYKHIFGRMHDMLSRSVNSLIEVYQIMRRERRQLPASSLAELREAMCRHLILWKMSKGKLIPKHHYAWHLVERASINGNPRFSWTYTDEQENRAMGQVAKSLHDGSTFYIRFLQKVLPEVCAGR